MQGEEFHLRRIGIDGDVHRAQGLVAKLDGKLDAIGVKMAPETQALVIPVSVAGAE